ncbi:MAG: sulfate transporter CysZ [Methylomonas sp.]|nr:MAG: sulfate transporter CysZ [Methylomonas sp.]PPD27858.1 MAG: sulfate transporter CysZ [Methylomonas sp.]PPD39968.1 MAG: sulfate transporter CysZ [Methylomonas sp.]PPD41052.1 MAG: sulfate transporter CysZ [Methylomonas sp.]PPD52038.1 MAG: sulfate transporter CysZ [Methylomonas sp.]
MLNLKPGQNPALVLSCLLEAFKLLTHPQLRKYLLMPLVINLVIYSGAFVLGYHWMDVLIQQFIPDWLHWLNWLLWPLFFVSFLVVGFFSFTLLANMIAAPWYCQLSARVLQLIHGHAITVDEAPWDRIFLGELKRMGYLLARILPLLVLSLIPVVNIVAPVLWMLFSAWGVAMEFMAYPLENRGLTFPEQKQFLNNARWSMLSFGGLTGLGLTLPMLNLVMGKVAVIAATLYIDRQTQQQ